MDTLWTQRLARVRDRLGLSQRELADKLGITGTAWQNYESGKSVPGGAVLHALFELGVDIHWLFSGDGTMFRNQPEPTPEAPQPTRYPSLGLLQKQLQASFLKNIGLLDVAPLATLGEIMTEYEVLLVLAQTHPEALTLAELHERLTLRGMHLEEETLVAFLQLLMRRGMVKVEGVSEQRIRLAERTSLLIAEGLSAHAQVAIQAVKMILRDALPKSDLSTSQGRIMHLRFFADEAEAAEFVSDLHRLLIAHCKSKDRNSGGVELALVAAVARGPFLSG